MIGPQQHIRTIVTSFHRLPKDAGRSLVVIVQLSLLEAGRILTGSRAEGFGVVAISWAISRGLKLSVLFDLALDSSSSFSIVTVTRLSIFYRALINLDDTQFCGVGKKLRPAPPVIRSEIRVRCSNPEYYETLCTIYPTLIQSQFIMFKTGFLFLVQFTSDRVDNSG